jgi:hypothetical protein
MPLMPHSINVQPDLHCKPQLQQIPVSERLFSASDYVQLIGTSSKYMESFKTLVDQRLQQKKQPEQHKGEQLLDVLLPARVSSAQLEQRPGPMHLQTS